MVIPPKKLPEEINIIYWIKVVERKISIEEYLYLIMIAEKLIKIVQKSHDLTADEEDEMCHPEQLKPEEQIFDGIDSIQSKISSQEYVDLMNTAQKLVQKIKDSEEDRMSEISDSSSTDNYEIHEPADYSSDSDSEIEQRSNYMPCDCLTRFSYPDNFPMYERHQTYSQMFCRGIRIFDCENFKRLCEEYPLLMNLIEGQNENMPFADRETYAPYESPKVKMVFSIFITLNDMFDYRRHKIIISLILFDFAMKNIQYLADNRGSFGQVAYDKFISFMYEEDFPEIAEEFNINLNNWRLALERAIAPPVIT
jgi:hypothetical protein